MPKNLILHLMSLQIRLFIQSRKLASTSVLLLKKIKLLQTRNYAAIIKYEACIHYAETLIQESRKEYNDVLSIADKAQDSTEFIEFMLTAVCDSLKEHLRFGQLREQIAAQAEKLLAALGDDILSAKNFWNDSD